MNQTNNNMHSSGSSNINTTKSMINAVSNNQVSNASADFHGSNNNNSQNSNSHNNLIRRISSGRKSGLHSEGLGQK